MTRKMSAFEMIENANSMLRFVGFNTVKPEDCILNWYMKDLEQLTTKQLGKLRLLAYREQQRDDCNKQTRKHCELIRERTVKILIRRALEGMNGKEN